MGNPASLSDTRFDFANKVESRWYPFYKDHTTILHRPKRSEIILDRNELRQAFGTSDRNTPAGPFGDLRVLKYEEGIRSTETDPDRQRAVASLLAQKDIAQ